MLLNAYVVKIYLSHMHKGSQSNQIRYCTSISHKLFPKYRISVRGSNLLVLKLINPLRGQVLFASYMLSMSSFSVVDAKGGEVLGTKAMENISNTKHH